jgi:CRP-like cAMP-binding protein
MYIISRGRVKVHTGSSLIAHIGDGSFFGEMAALSPEPRSASITAESETHCLCLEQHSLKAFLEQNPEAAIGIIHVLCERIRQALNRTSFSILEEQKPEKESIHCSTPVKQDFLEKLLLFLQHPEFHTLSPGMVKEIIEEQKIYLYEDGHILYNQCDNDQRLFFLESGCVELQKGTECFEILTPGALFGFISALDGNGRESSARVRGQARVLSIQRSALNTLFWSKRDLPVLFLSRLINTLRTLNKM